MSSWRDATGNGNDVTQSTASMQPTYYDSWANLNGQPAIKGDGVDDAMWEPESPQLLQDQPTDWVFALSDADESYIRDWHSTGSGHAVFYATDSAFGGPNWATYAGSVLDSGVATDTGAHLVICRFNGTSSSIEVDSSVIASGDAGIAATYSAKLWARYNPSSDFSPAALAFHGVSNGLLTSSEKAELLDWARTHYGTP